MSGGPARNTKVKRALSWAAASVGVLLLLASAAEWIRRGRHVPENVTPADALPSATPRPTTGPAPISWPSLLSAQRCEAPCCGGEACAVDASNARDYAQFCRPGQKGCAACASGLTCIPGGCELELASGEAWQLRVSAVRAASTPVRSVCDPGADPMRVCVVKAAGVRACWTNTELCASKGPTLPLTTDDLMGAGIDVEIQDAAGKVVSKARRKFTEGMRRRGLCTGYVVRGFAPQVAYGEVQFFLMPQ